MPASATINPEASIIIVTYNGRRYLADCLTSTFDDLADSGEVIVVDNKSTDGGPQFIREYFPAVRLVENQENDGFAAACNQGARLARGRVLVFLNQDTQVFPGWLDALVQELDRENDIGLVTSRLLLMSRPDRIHLCGQDVHYTGLVFGRGYSEPADRFNTAGDVNAVSGASFAIRRDLWETLGGFDEGFYMYYEETDLSWRAQLAGYRCCYAPASQALHDYRPGSASDSRLYYSFRNRTILWLKNWHWMTLILITPALLLAEVVEVGLAMAQGSRGVKAKVMAHGWIITHLPELRRMRAAAQAGRRVSDVIMLESLAADIRPKYEQTGRLSRLSIGAANLLFMLNRKLAHWALQGLPRNSRTVQRGQRQ